MGNFTWSGRERVQEPTVYQTELVFHATRCKQIYLIRTPCSYCIQSHFLYRQKEKKKKSFGSKFLQYYKKRSKLCVSLIKLDIFFFFFLFLFELGSQSQAPPSQRWSVGQVSTFLDISFDLKPFLSTSSVEITDV